MVNWNPYLESLCKKYASWWKAYTLTDVIGHQRLLEVESVPLLDFMVRTIQPAREESSQKQEKTELLDVLAELRKYAPDHVLLVGQPGSGKSTALMRLLLEEAEKARSPSFPPFQGGKQILQLSPWKEGQGGIIFQCWCSCGTTRLQCWI